MLHALFRLIVLAAATLWGSVAYADTFHGYECLEDCSGHEAGYEWAEQNDITDPDDCDGNSQSFIEGCQAWAEENADEDLADDSESMDEDDEDDE